MEHARKKSNHKRITAVLLALALIVAMCPIAQGQAHATQTSNSNAGVQVAENQTAEGEGDTQDASKVTVTLETAETSLVSLTCDGKTISSGDTVESGKELQVTMKNSAVETDEAKKN